MSDNNVSGMKLLILGGAPNEIPIIKRAQELGVYVIVTDMYLDHRVSPGKDIANEFWDVSWSDISELKRHCVECGVNGILGGFSEIKIEAQIALCKELGFPCYITNDQLEITRNKVLFKQECRKYGVPVIKEYNSIEEVTTYPVIVKPVDRAGSIGVGIANNKLELTKAFEYALEKSLVKKVIIEDYITDSIEMDVHYAIVDGKIFLLVTDDIIPAVSNKEDGKVIQSAWMYPDRYEEDFLVNADPLLRKMINGMGVKDGTIFFSGFVNSQKEFKFFECGFRLWGEQEFEYDFLKGPMNYLDVYIYHALTGSTKGVEIRLNKNPNLKGVEINLYSTSGTVNEVTGFNEVCENNDCYLAIQYSFPGKECDCSMAISPKHALFGFANENPQQLKNDVDYLLSTYNVLDENGESMIYDKIDTDKIQYWWN